MVDQNAFHAMSPSDRWRELRDLQDRHDELRRLTAAFIEALADYQAGKCWSDKPDLALAALRAHLEGSG
jgi:hypothetical protein